MQRRFDWKPFLLAFVMAVFALAAAWAADEITEYNLTWWQYVIAGGAFALIGIANANEILDLVERIVAAAAPQVPHVLRPQKGFVGRTDILKQLTRDIRRGKTQIVGLRGMGGVGKTETAKTLAKRVARRYRSGGLMVDLKGVSGDPMSPEDALAILIRQARGADTVLPDDLVSLRIEFERTLRGAKMIILLDNAFDAEQVSHLLPPDKCLTLITTRHDFEWSGPELHDLDVLPMRDAVTLLRRICPRIGECAEGIAEELGCLPDALDKAASALKVQRAISPQSFLETLQKQDGTLTYAEKALSASTGLLDEALRERWCQLAVFPADFDAGGAAAVWGLLEREDTAYAQDIKDAQPALGDLVKRSLVQYDAETGRYRLHDLARDYAAHLACCDKPDGLDEARLRHARHYLQVLSAADDRYLEGNEGVLDGLAAFDREWPNIEAGQRWAAEHAGEGGEAATLCSRYPSDGRHCLVLRQHPREQIAWLEDAHAAATALGEKSHESVHLGNLGIAYAQLGEVNKAIEHHTQALAIGREIGDRRGEGNALGNLGTAYHRLGEVEKAIEHHTQALAISRELGDRRAEGQDLGNLGLAYADLGEVEKAIERHTQALAISREIGDRRAEGRNLGNLGLAYGSLGQVEKAIEYLEQRLEIAREIGDRFGEGAALGNLGNAYLRLGEIQKAIEHYQPQLEITREIGDRRGEGSALGSLGIAYKNLGKVERAVEHYLAQLEIAHEIGNRIGEAAGRFNLGILLEETDRPDEAREQWEIALRLREEMGLEEPAERVRLRLASLDR